MKHGVYASENDTSVATPVVAESGVPFVIGVSPVQSADEPAPVGVPVLCASWDDAVKKFGYSDEWDKYNISEFMYSHFKLYGCQPVVFVNVLDVTKSTHKEAVSASSHVVASHKVELPLETINDSALVVKNNSTALVKGTDYAVFYDDGKCIIELLEDGSAYAATTLTINYNKAKPSGVTTTEITAAIEAIELCVTTIGTTPDILVIPGYSDNATVAAAMAAKAKSINGLFKGKALVDLDCASTATVNAAVTKKSTDGMTDKAMVVCWPMAKKGDKMFHLSTLVAGTIASVDADNDGVPYESPSNKAIVCDALCLENGTELNVTFAEANVLNAAGIVTALNFINGWVVWGNYTGCYPASADVKDYFIPVSRMFAWVNNTLIKTFWSKVDRPMSPRLVDSIVDSANIWLNGLVGQGYVYGARVEFIASENTLEQLMAGIVKLHVYITPPSPMQEIDFTLEYDVNYVTSALQ